MPLLDFPVSAFSNIAHKLTIKKFFKTLKGSSVAVGMIAVEIKIALFDFEHLSWNLYCIHTLL